MAKRSETPLMEPLGNGEFGELDDLLLSDDLPETCMDAVTLEGFLTAIAIGPVTVTPDHWLPLVFGSAPEDPMPELPSYKIFNRVVNLIIRLYNSVLMIFEIAPEKFSPTFYTREIEGKTYTIVDEWCSGFLQGIAVASYAWQPLLLRSPIYCGPSNSSLRLKAGQNWMRRRTRPRCMQRGPARLNRRSTPYMLIGYLIEKLLEQPWLHPVPREWRENQRWVAMRHVPVGAERNTNIAVVPLVHCIDSTALNA